MNEMADFNKFELNPISINPVWYGRFQLETGHIQIVDSSYRRNLISDSLSWILFSQTVNHSFFINKTMQAAKDG